MKIPSMLVLTLAVSAAFLALSSLGLTMTRTEAVSPPFPSSQEVDGAQVFDARCATCHVGGDLEADVPNRDALGNFSPNFIVTALTEGTMTLQGQDLSPAERAAVAEFLTDQVVVDRPVTITEGLCTEVTPMADPATAPLWNGWGPGVTNARFQPASEAGLTAADLDRLTLKWAFGLPGETQARAQPAIAGGRLFTGSQAGAVYALDAMSGCTYWTFLPQAGVRSAFSVGPIQGPDGTATWAVYFVDNQAHAYAVDANTGRQIWSTQVEDHPAVRGTGSVTLYDGRLYVPMTGVSEENAASSPDYECCRFRGSITALDARTGDVVWKTYTVPEPERRGTSSTGVPLWGPAGVGIWSAPTIDVARHRIYAATGNAYADPPQETADAVIALDLDTGEIEWVNQLTPGDTWIGGCPPNSDNPNCPGEVGPDFDFSASPLLTTLDGEDLIVVTQKAGMGYALDPDNDGELVWEYRWGGGSGVGGVWGASVGDGNAYFAVGGYAFGGGESGGIHAVDLATGAEVWFTPPQDLLCAAAAPPSPAVPPAGGRGAGRGGPRGGARGGGGRGGCGATQSAAVTAIPGAVFSGSADGGMRAYSASDGTILWTFDANREFETVNGVPANGGSFDGSGPVVAGGMLYMLSGNGGFVGSPGNVLLAFGLE